MNACKQKCLQKLGRLVPVASGFYIVGGAVRDCLLGNHPLDVDLATKDDPEQLARKIARKFGTRTICLHQDEHHLFRVVTKDYTFDITALAEAGLKADLLRRDFTINAMAYDPAAGRLIDILDARKDLKSAVVRMTGPDAFATDALRLVRAFRMAACLSFSICPRTLEAVSRMAGAICSVAGERIRAEIFRLLSARGTSGLIGQMHTTGLLTALFPEIKALADCPASQYHAFDGLTHSLATYAALENCLENPPGWIKPWARMWPAPDQPLFAVLKLAALLHDIGKPATQKGSGTQAATYHGHAEAGGRMAGGIARRLRFSSYEQKKLEFLINHHMYLSHLFQLAKTNKLTRRAMGRFFRIAGEMTGCLLVLFAADTLAKGRPAASANQTLAEFSHLLRRQYQEAVSRKQSRPRLVTGRDLIEIFKLKPSPFFKTVLEQVAELYLGGVLTTRDQALEWVARYLAQADRQQSPG